MRYAMDRARPKSARLGVRWNVGVLLAAGCAAGPTALAASDSPEGDGQRNEQSIDSIETDRGRATTDGDLHQHTAVAAEILPKPASPRAVRLPPPAESNSNSAVVTTQYTEVFDWSGGPSETPLGLFAELRNPADAEDLPPGTFAVEQEVFPIDLPTVLRLAGANNLQIALAAERVNQAAAHASAARALWIPSLSAGVVYNHHDGRIQGTEGEVLDASRSSLFTGAGLVAGSSPTTGGAGNPRMFVDLSLADALFEPLAARQLVRATAADRTATFNDTLLQVSATYFALARAQARVAITEEAVRNAEELSRITSDFAETGQGLQADADRAQVELAARRRDVLVAREELAVISAELARLVRLDPAVRLASADETPTPLPFIDVATPVRVLIDQAVAARPELRSADAQRDAAWYSRRQEQLRPWIPHLYAGISGGGFGGGEGSSIDSFGGRADYDVAALWELQNLGFGNVARQREQQSVLRQADIAMQQVLDQIAADVAQSHQRVQLRQRQIDVTQPQMASAEQALRLNLEGIRGGVLRPIEIQQAIGALASARMQYLDAVIDYNAAQLQLLRAIGRPPEAEIVR